MKSDRRQLLRPLAIGSMVAIAQQVNAASPLLPIHTSASPQARPAATVVSTPIRVAQQTPVQPTPPALSPLQPIQPPVEPSPSDLIPGTPPLGQAPGATTGDASDAAAARSRLRQQKAQTSDRDEKDAVELAEPKVADPPISLSPLQVPNLSLTGVGNGEIPDDETDGRLPPPILLPIGVERGIGLVYTKTWVNPGFCHQPLYYEDAMLEQHGHQRFPLLQPMISGARFYGTAFLSPYQWTLRHPLSEQHTLGSYRPGTPAPLLRQRPPYEPEAIRNQLGATAAAAVAIP